MAGPDGVRTVLPRRLDLLVDQLWRPAVEIGAVRVVLGGRPEPHWREVERYRVIPSASRATMLFPDRPRAAAVGAMLNHRGLRRPVPNLQRAVLGTMRYAGVSPPFTVLSVQVATRLGSQAPALPLATLADALGTGPVYASMRVNLSSNRKPLLQVVDASGRSVGFAKFAWGPASARAVESEREALREVGGRPGPVRAPGLLAQGDFHGHPFVVTAPIPPESLGLGSRGVSPTLAETFTLCPIVRVDRVRGTAQFRALSGRLRALPSLDDQGVVGRALDLVDVIAEGACEVPIVQRWHGDLTSWNAARDGEGTLWCWDWESSEEDAVAGMDSLHWHFAERARGGDLWDGAALAHAFEQAQRAFVGAGIPRPAWGEVAGVYAATMVERACHLAAGPVGWEQGWVGPEQLQDLLRVARALVDRSRQET